MGEVDRTRLRAALRRRYATQTAETSPVAVEALANAMLSEDARFRRAEGRTGLAAFVAAQVRYIPAWTWFAQVAIVALMWAVSCASKDGVATALSVSVLSSMTVLVGVPTVQASKAYGVAELEYSCPNNAASVMVARLIVLGCSSALAVAVMVGVASASLDAGILTVAVWVCPPFFCSCAGALALLRKAPPPTGAALSIAWVAGCSALLLAIAAAFPEVYNAASLTVWAGAAAVALLWFAREAVVTVRSVSAGLDSHCPHLVRKTN